MKCFEVSSQNLTEDCKVLDARYPRYNGRAWLEYFRTIGCIPDTECPVINIRINIEGSEYYDSGTFRSDIAHFPIMSSGAFVTNKGLRILA